MRSSARCAGLGSPQVNYIDPDGTTGTMARVLLGSLGAAKSKVKSDLPATYLCVKLSAGKTWRYAPPVGHSVLWVALATGSLNAPDFVEAGEMIIFDSSEIAVTLTAETDTEFVLGSAKPHLYALELGPV